METSRAGLSITSPSLWIVAAAFLLTLGIYRVPTPFGYNVTFSHLLLVGAFYFGSLAFLAGAVRTRLSRPAGQVVLIFLIYAGYSFLLLLKNVDRIQSDSLSQYFSEVMGYGLLLGGVFLLDRFPAFQRAVSAFLASNVFIYLGAFWHLYSFVALGTIVTGTPFWHQGGGEYLERSLSFFGFPRLRLPFATPHGAGVYLSLSAILFFSFALQRLSRSRRDTTILFGLMILNVFCLIGTLARACWAVYVFGCLFVLWLYRRVGALRVGRLVFPVVIMIVVIFTLANALSVVNQALEAARMRFDLEATERTNQGHLATRLLALRYWTESPLWGLGIGGYTLKPDTGPHTHSTYFTILVDRGLIGLFLYLLFFGKLYALLWNTVRETVRRGEKARLPYAVGLLGGLTGLAVGNLLYQMTAEYISFFFGLCIVCGSLTVDGREPAGPGSEHPALAAPSS